MDTKNKNEELQSRRDFFKKAAKTALPILGTIVLANTPNIIKAAGKNPMGCTGTCYMGCKNACKGCQYTCVGGCKNTSKGY